MQGENILEGVSRFITTLLEEGLQGAVPPSYRLDGGDLPKIVQEVRSFILKGYMLARWDPPDLLLGMGALVHPRHKSLPWLNTADKKRIVCRMHTEMINTVSGLNIAADEEEAGDPKKPALKRRFQSTVWSEKGLRGGGTGTK